MLDAIELQLIKAAQLVAFLSALDADDPKPRIGARNCVVPRIGLCEPSVSAARHAV
jgi:hypothetical protein